VKSVLEPSKGLVKEDTHEGRYDGHVFEPDETTGIVCEYVPPKSRVLDVGCGSGSFSCILRDKTGAIIVGVEPSEMRAAVAKERGIEVIQDQLSPQLLEPLGQFDVVLFADVLEHLSDPELALTTIRTCLTPNGFLVASVPNVAHWSVRWNLLWGKFEYEPSGIMDATHLRWFTKATFHRLLNSAGFEICQSKYTPGTFLSVYSQTWPWRSLSPYYRGRLVRLAMRWWPSLFGCQVVVQARLSDRSRSCQKQS
jgi:methionine biosynthesis protein MetW